MRYDVAIAGGGLAGLALSIQLAEWGYSVVVFEQKKYPFHRVCGEYVSLESWDFLLELGIAPHDMDVSHITRLQVSLLNGKLLRLPLPLGGFGISRYELDHALAQSAIRSGVIIMENTKVNDMRWDEAASCFTITTSRQKFSARVACATYGKRSNLDVQWKRRFAARTGREQKNYIGIKYHIKTKFHCDTIALHNFRNGYCGMVKIEGDRYCLCYLTTADNLQRADGSIDRLEKEILAENPGLKTIFENCEKLYSPVAISQVSFEKKEQVEHRVLMIGDAAGMIAPLCGNGMSMALRGSKIAAGHIRKFLNGNISREQMEINYTADWRKAFAHRLRMGRVLQQLLNYPRLVNMISRFPWLLKILIRQTHGRPF